MHSIKPCPDQRPPSATRFALFSLGSRHRNQESLRQMTQEMAETATHAREAAQLLRQISIKAPQLASVLEQLHEGSAGGRRIEFSEQAQEAAPRERCGAVLDMTAGVLSQAFPAAAPLFHGCRTFLQLKLVKKKQARSL
jgi:hypothetical protein